MPFADVLYACDEKWWDKYHDTITIPAQRWTQDIDAKRKYGINWILGASQKGLGYDRVHFGGSSGYQAINLAFLWGATRIVLLGFDCKPVAGKDHWFGQHPQGLTQVQPYNLWLERYPQLAYDLKREGVEVINCSRDTALTCFERATIETVTD